MTLSYTCVDVSLHGRQLRASPSAHIGSIASVQARVVALRRIELKTPLRPQSGVGVARPIFGRVFALYTVQAVQGCGFCPARLPYWCNHADRWGWTGRVPCQKCFAERIELQSAIPTPRWTAIAALPWTAED